MPPEPKPTDAPGTPAAPEAEVGPRVYGVIDVVRPTRVAGWAIDRGDAAAAVDVEIRREGRLVATVRADRLRRDLEKGAVGTGRYGFVAELDPALEPGFEFTITAVARTHDGVRAELKRAGTPTAPARPEHRLMERLFEEVTRLGTAPAPAPAPRVAEDADRLREMLERIELVQARIEATLAAAETPPAPAPRTGLAIALGLALTTGLGSLALGLYSMWQP